MKYRYYIFSFFIWSALSFTVEAQQPFPLSVTSNITVINISKDDYEGVAHAAQNLQQDIEKVTGRKPELANTESYKQNVILIGTIGKNKSIDLLIGKGKLNVTEIKGQWEAYVIQVVENPSPNVDRALVIAGSDKRGTIFGIYEVSKQIGVSPWYWWADVPVKKQTELYFPSQRQTSQPTIKYRGIFINDEAPALSGWATEKFGGFNHKFYENVYELILRLKGNYLWPAMWGRAIYDDDSLSAKLADEYGVVIGTSHHEPMMRAHVEWQRYGKGEWNYEKNEKALQEFWRKGIERMGSNESIVSLGMRGDGDMAMTKETNVALLERIVEDQRKILKEATKKEPDQIPQMWALYKEVQDYYDEGMRVPDDVTLLLCDDNWGNIRKLPKLSEPPRKGGYGIYYHFDYVGGPRNYKWLNTNQIERVWEQMNLAYNYGATTLWIVNVGDIKPMELPISFFLDYAWNPSLMQANQLQSYTETWCAQQFGSIYAREIASLISLYTKYNSRIKPELLNENTYNLNNYNEFEHVVKEYQQLRSRAVDLAAKLTESQQEAYYQLVLHPISASSNLYEMYYHVALNKQAVQNNNVKANVYADRVKEFYQKDSLITMEYHKRNNGKWNHMMSQTHIGYTNWQQPPVNKMPAVQYLTTGVHSESEETKARKKVKPQSKSKKGNAFVESEGYVSIEAEHFSRAIESGSTKWTIIPNLGKTGSSVSLFPVTHLETETNQIDPHLEYDISLANQGEIKINLYFSPTLDFHNKSLRYAIAIDDEASQIINIQENRSNNATWGKWVANNIIIKTSNHKTSKPGKHTIKFWAIDAGIVLQKIVVDTGGLKESYLGPPESNKK
ncbi:MAG TPA: glycosyl hydrolase 115 family protein [Cyclobacteriaceae bacterium]